jgi:hypothetical protein
MGRRLLLLIGLLSAVSDVAGVEPYVSYVRACCGGRPTLKVGLDAKVKYEPYWTVRPLEGTNVTLGETIAAESGRA